MTFKKWFSFTVHKKVTMKKIFLLIAIGMLFNSCEKLLFEEDQMSLNPQENFEYLWKECDEKYSYFELKGIDWNQIYDEYQAKIYEGMSDDSLFNVLGGMLTELRDGHVNLVSNFNKSYFWIQNLGQDNFDWRIVTDHYLPLNYYVSGPFRHDFLNDTNQEIGYIRFNKFTGVVDKENLDFVLERYKDTKGIIIDIRENGGGDPEDAFDLLSRFIDEETLLNYSRVKNGPAHNDFAEEESTYIQPSEDIRYTKKVMVLTDRTTFSAGSFTALATKALPQVSLVGDTTGGGLGLPNGGQLPNGWTYRFSVTQALDLNKDNQYENGVPPDMTVLFDWSDLSKDEIIEKAIEEIFN